jgi:hypothetical protein
MRSERRARSAGPFTGIRHDANVLSGPLGLPEKTGSSEGEGGDP